MVVPVNVARKPQRQRAQTTETPSLGPKTRFGEYPGLKGGHILRNEWQMVSEQVAVSPGMRTFNRHSAICSGATGGPWPN